MCIKVHHGIFTECFWKGIVSSHQSYSYCFWKLGILSKILKYLIEQEKNETSKCLPRWHFQKKKSAAEDSEVRGGTRGTTEQGGAIGTQGLESSVRSRLCSRRVQPSLWHRLHRPKDGPDWEIFTIMSCSVLLSFVFIVTITKNVIRSTLHLHTLLLFATSSFCEICKVYCDWKCFF